MHLAAVSGAVMEKEYPRLPLTLFSAAVIGRGGTSDFGDPNGIGERLFGLQHGAQGDSRDSYALYPLKGVSGTVGLIGIFNHRPITAAEQRWLAQLAPAAVAAIRVAELQSRAALYRQRLEKESAQASTLKQSAAARELELEDAVAQLTLQVAQLQVEREPLVRAGDEATIRANRAEEEKLIIEESAQRLRNENRELRERAESLLAVQQESGRAYSEMAAQLESERRRVEEENSWLKGRLATREQNVAEQSRVREALAAEVAERNRELISLKAQLESSHAELLNSRETLPRLQDRLNQLEDSNRALRDHNSAISESVDDLEASLRIAEDARARLEQIRVFLEQQVEKSADENSRLRLENDRTGGENEQLVTEIERLRADLEEMREAVARASEARTLDGELTQALEAAEERAQRLEQEKASLSSEIAMIEKRARELEDVKTTLLRDIELLGERGRELESENASLGEANSQLEEAVNQFRQLTARLEERRGERSHQIGAGSALPRNGRTESPDYSRDSGSGSIHREHVSRASHADECDYRVYFAPPRRSRFAHDRPPSSKPGTSLAERPRPAGADQQRSGSLQDRCRPDGRLLGAGRSARPD
jgi:chromosome segregation ATPase